MLQSQPEENKGPPKILVVDDELMNIEVITSMLNDQGYKTDSVMSGKEAIEKVKQRIELYLQGEAENYRLIFLDYSMPDKDGIQVAKEIIQMFKGKKNLG